MCCGSEGMVYVREEEEVFVNKVNYSTDTLGI